MKKRSTQLKSAGSRLKRPRRKVSGSLERIDLDAATFQKPLQQLAEVLSQKVKREAPKLHGFPEFVGFDLHVLTRQAQHTYDLLFYINADERRETDCYWRSSYSVVTLPLIRNMIDSLYNITAILQDPRRNGPHFRKSGYQKFLKGFDEDQARYQGRPEWDDWISRGRAEVDFEIRKMGFTVADVLSQKEWPTLGQYIGRKQAGGTLTPHQGFLKTLLYGQWREYSAMAHGSSDALCRTAIFYVSDSLPHEERPKLEDGHLRLLSMHIGQAAAVLLCIVTELQAHFRFDGADINQRIHKMWDALMPAFVVKELYSKRYKKLMSDKGI
jgi:hypothetical protein